MTSNIRRVAVLLLLAPGCIFGQTERDKALSACEKLAPILRIPFDRSKAVFDLEHRDSRTKPVIQVITPNCLYVMDDSSKFLTSMSCDARLMELNKGGKYDRRKFYRSSEDCWKRADEIVKSIGFGKNDVLRGTCVIGNNEPMLDGRVFMSYRANTFGFPTDGEYAATITLDAHDGAVLSLRSTRAWKYVKPVIKLNRDAAIRAATEALINAGLKPKTKPLKIDIRYPVSNDGFGSTLGLPLAKRYEYRLCYTIRWDHQNVYIDAQTGRCLGGYGLQR